jgi:hypothetical protein
LPAVSSRSSRKAITLAARESRARSTGESLRLPLRAPRDGSSVVSHSVLGGPSCVNLLVSS